MGAGCPCRARGDAELESEEEEDEENLDLEASWSSLVRLNRRLAYRRRLWAFLGHWLRQVKERGRASLVSQ